MARYEEHTVFNTFWSWVLIILSSVVIVGWGMYIMMAIMDHQDRHWDFGTVPDAPSESVYSTVNERNGSDVPEQIEYPR